MRNFGKKWFISASSGILGKILLVAFGLGVGIAGSKFISLPADNNLVKGILVGIFIIIIIPVFLGSIVIAADFESFLEWLSIRRKQEHEKLELENENLKLKLELRRQEQQSPPDNQE